jgi:hypothetical protein
VPYGAGPRVSLKGKGRPDRFAMLFPKLLELLRDWYRIARQLSPP